MIYSSDKGKADGKEIRLRTLESVWLQGKLRMWGRWSYIGARSIGGGINQLLARKTVSKTAITLALKQLKKAGLSESELSKFLSDLVNGQQKSSIAHCTDAEALTIDRVVGETFAKDRHIITLLHERYEGKGKSKKKMALALHDAHPEWCIRTCESRIDRWLSMAEKSLYEPMCVAFEKQPNRFY